MESGSHFLRRAPAGITLVEVLLASTLIGAATLGFARIARSSFGGQRVVIDRGAVEDLRNFFRAALDCRVTLDAAVNSSCAIGDGYAIAHNAAGEALSTERPDEWAAGGRYKVRVRCGPRVGRDRLLVEYASTSGGGYHDLFAGGFPLTCPRPVRVQTPSGNPSWLCKARSCCARPGWEGEAVNDPSCLATHTTGWTPQLDGDGVVVGHTPIQETKCVGSAGSVGNFVVETALGGDFDPRYRPGYDLYLGGGKVKHCTGVVLRVWITGNQSGRSVDLQCRGDSCHGGNRFLMRYEPKQRYTIRPEDMGGLLDDQGRRLDADYTLRIDWESTVDLAPPGGPGCYCGRYFQRESPSVPAPGTEQVLCGRKASYYVAAFLAPSGVAPASPTCGAAWGLE